MSTVLHIAEFADNDTALPAATLPALHEQSVLIQGKSTVSEPFGPHTALVRLYAYAACTIAAGKDPEATTGSMPMAAGSEAYFHVAPGHKLAVLAQ